jgi:hypothetical protein
MALPSSGPLSISAIRNEQVNNGGFASSYSLRQLSANAGKSSPDAISEFYGYAANPIPTSGLLIQVDAGNSSSYPGSGTTWTDISGNGNSATLVGLGYTSDGGGAITFPNNCSSYATFGDKNAFTTKFSFFLWVKRSNGANARIMSKDIGYYTNREYAIQVGGSGQLNTIVWNQSGTLAIASGGGNIGTGWTMVGGTWDGSTIRTYNNNALNSTAALSGTTTYNSSMPLELGRVQEGCFEPFAGSIAMMIMYNRAVSGTEVTQIFNAYKSRYGY